MTFGHRDIIDLFGGASALARMLGHRNPTTVQGWYVRDKIPIEQQRAVLDCAGTPHQAARIRRILTAHLRSAA